MGRPSETKAAEIAKAMPANERYLLTRKVAAEYLGISTDAIYEHEVNGDIGSARYGKGKNAKCLYRRKDVEQLGEMIFGGRTFLDRMTTV